MAAATTTMAAGAALGGVLRRALSGLTTRGCRSAAGLASASTSSAIAAPSREREREEPAPAAARILDVRKVAAEWLAEVAEEVSGLRERFRRPPGLSVVLVGTRADSVLYVNRKRQAAAKVGIAFRLIELPEDVTQERLIAAVEEEYNSRTTDGVLVQLPLPSHIDEEAILEHVDPRKDVDGLHPLNVGRLSMRGRQPSFVPCTPLGCIELLKRLGHEVAGKNAVVVGNSNTVGTPLSMLLRDAGAASVTVCHCTSRDFASLDRETQEYSKDSGLRAAGGACLPPLPSGGSSSGGGFRHLQAGALEHIPRVTRSADILFVAVGHPELVRGSWVKPGCVVVDVGINAKPLHQGEDIRKVAKEMLARSSSLEVSIVGDVAFGEVAHVATAVTPVPGGVGPMTIAALMENTLVSAKRAMHEDWERGDGDGGAGEGGEGGGAGREAP